MEGAEALIRQIAALRNIKLQVANGNVDKILLAKEERLKKLILMEKSPLVQSFIEML